LLRPKGKTVLKLDDAYEVANELGYPVLVRPSYVIGGSRMEIVYDDDELKAYLAKSMDYDTKHPILIDKYLTGIEVEVDDISDGETTIMLGIMLHSDRADCHSVCLFVIYL